MKFKVNPFIPLMVFAILLSVAGTACESASIETLVINGILDPCEDTVPDPSSGGGDVTLSSSGKLDLAVQNYMGNSGYNAYLWVANTAASSLDEAANMDEGNRIQLKKVSVSFITPSSWTKLSGFSKRLNLVLSPEMAAGLRVDVITAETLEEIREIYRTRSYLSEQQLAYSDEMLYMDYDDYREIFEDLYVLCESIQQEACMATVLQAKLISDIEPMLEEINALSGGGAASIIAKIEALRTKVDSLKNGQTRCHPQTAFWDCNGFACKIPIGMSATVDYDDHSNLSFPADLNNGAINRIGYCRSDCSVFTGCANRCDNISMESSYWVEDSISVRSWVPTPADGGVKSCDFGPQDNGICRTSCLQGSVDCEPFLHPISGEIIMDYDCHNTVCTPKTEDLNPHMPSTLIVKIKISGTRMDGSSIESNPFYYSIDVCKGCLISSSSMDCEASSTTVRQYFTEVYGSDCMVIQQDYPVHCGWLNGCNRTFCQ